MKVGGRENRQKATKGLDGETPLSNYVPKKINYSVRNDKDTALSLETVAAKLHATFTPTCDKYLHRMSHGS